MTDKPETPEEEKDRVLDSMEDLTNKIVELTEKESTDDILSIMSILKAASSIIGRVAEDKEHLESGVGMFAKTFVEDARVHFALNQSRKPVIKLPKKEIIQ